MTPTDSDPKSPPSRASRKGNPGVPSLATLLAQFEPKLHGGEAMSWNPIGVEFSAPSQRSSLARSIAG